ncbi:MAG: hypothetical protein M3Y80_02955 [Verrucomicrobiota bacterium]|nr:hypothetical protein [Verrucomicrobiota bacterium]
MSIVTARAEQLYDNGPPGLSDGYEITHWREGDRFAVDQGIVVNQVRYWDFQLNSSAFSGAVLWEIRANSPTNMPGAPLYSGIAVDPIRTATGRVNVDPLFPVPEYVVTFDVPSLVLPAGSYWLVLHNGPLSNNTGQSLFWEAAVNTSTEPSRSDVAPFVADWRSNSSSSAPFSKMAFRLFGAPASAIPRVTSVTRTNRVPLIAFTTAAGQSYQVQFKNTFVDPTWAVVTGAENVAGSGSTVEIADSDPAATQIPHRFYRVILKSTPTPAIPLLPAPSQSPARRDVTPNNSLPENSLRRRLPLATVEEMEARK